MSEHNEKRSIEWNWHGATVTLHVRLPGELCAKAVALDIGECMASCMRPLPRDRELPWAFEEQRKAQQMLRDRKAASRQIADAVTEALLQVITERDPVNGYGRNTKRSDGAERPA